MTDNSIAVTVHLFCTE